MSILVQPDTKVIIQGITGSFGARHARLSLGYGTQVVAGVTPGKGGQTFDDRIPIFDTVAEAARVTGATVSAIFVPAAFAADAIVEAVDADLDLVVCITEGIPVRDMIQVRRAMLGRRTRLIGPNCPGIVTPGAGPRSEGGCRIGIAPGYIHRAGHIGVVSRSGTLTYEAVWQLTCRGVGQSTCVGIGGDPLPGLSHLEVIKLFNDDPETHGIIMIGEIGGTAEEEAAAWVGEHCKKPVAGFVAGATAPPGRRMGHAGAIISGGKGTAVAKIDAMRAAGIAVADTPAVIGGNPAPMHVMGMFLVDLILNFAGLLLWLSWQALGVTAATRPTALSLVSTLKRAESRLPRRRTPLLFLLVLLLGRSVVYWQLGPSVKWEPWLYLGVVSLHFRGDTLGTMTLYSWLSFGQVLGIYYLALMLIAVANTRTPDSDPFTRMARMQLGVAGHLPAAVGVLVPMVAGGVLWLGLGWPLGRMGLHGPVPSAEMLWQQALVFGLSLYLVWYYLLILLLIVHLLNSYVYLGNAPFWHFLALTGRNALRPLRWFPLTVGRVDFTPVLGIALAFLAAYHWTHWGRWLFQKAPW